MQGGVAELRPALRAPVIFVTNSVSLRNGWGLFEQKSSA
jgi:hypothetical protein